MERHAAVGCEGTVLVHEDGSYTCTDGDCEASGSRLVAMSRHTWFVACRVALGADCPMCEAVRGCGFADA